MLSKWAFNALLKILEEPPKHVKFILATTETHKVPETIISRCQRYDFKRINSNDLKNRLIHISKWESINIDDQSLDYIVNHSAWGLRDAISLFEQLIHDNKITYDDIINKLWIVNWEVLDNFLKKLLNNDVSITTDFDNLVEDWKNIKLFIKEFIFYIKSQIISELKNNNDISKYINIIDILDDTYGKTKNSLDENTTLLIWILKIVSNFQEPNIQEVNSDIKTSSNTQIKQESIVNKVVESNKDLKSNTNTKSKVGIQVDDIGDIFWGEEEKSNTSKIKSDTTNMPWSDFDTNIFISKLKENKAKWWLTMSIRWCKLSLDWNILNVQATTTIAKNQIENADNTAIILKTLEDMGVNWAQIKII